MKRLLTLLPIWLCLLACPAQAQKVGLVLSGGGAKGITHVGVIHALEDNGIPIDYITGTSIGAVVGSLYAVGYSPEEMMDFFTSPEFNKYYTGSIDEGNIYYIKKNDPTPEFLNVRTHIRGDSINFATSLPTHLINPIYLNLVTMEMFCAPTAACEGDFDKLFVPFRCVASNVYEKTPITFSKGDLATAVKASMAFPFVFKPVNVDGDLAFDGGIYNNFPADVMTEDFHPDFIVGSNVSQKEERPDPDDIVSQISTLIRNRNTYEPPDSNSIVLRFDLSDEVGLLDFNKAWQLHDLGYEITSRAISRIRDHVSREADVDSLNRRRQEWRDSLPPVVFRNIFVRGTKSNQRRYLTNEIRTAGHTFFTLGEFRRGYFRLLSDNTITEIRPTAIYRPHDHTFDLDLDVSMEESLMLMLGGALSTSSINQIYYGIYYNHLGRSSLELQLDGQVGQIYNNVQLMSRVNVPSEVPMSFRLLAAFSTIDYHRQDYLFVRSASSSALNRETEAFAKLKCALPFMTQQKAEIGVGYGHITDSYVPGATIDLNNPIYDTNTYDLLGGTLFFGKNSLNSPQYATRGQSQYLLAQIFTGRSVYLPGIWNRTAQADDEAASQRSRISWLQILFKDQRYLPLRGKFVLGTYAEGFFSSRDFAQTFTATMMQANAFAPTPSMTFVYDPYFRADKYMAAGLVPIYKINNVFQLRLEGYVFSPLRPILQADDNTAHYGTYFGRIGHIEELSIAGQYSTIAFSGYLHHSSSPANPWTAGITVGWQLFNTRFIER
ncbi:MAG: patatin-like phospholipase family protein [Bacteroidaceae bacterium]|nr:patatin-like phospholipase family protein [Bacteroidaceae bacterium]